MGRVKVDFKKVAVDGFGIDLDLDEIEIDTGPGKFDAGRVKSA